jgi:predicted nucleic acid-binding protein
MDLVDTDVLIDVWRGHPPAVAWFNGLSRLPLLPGFVGMELVKDTRNKTEVIKALVWISSFSVVWPTSVECDKALELYSTFHLSHGLGLVDSVIASTAIVRNDTLLTFNDKHFIPLPGLTILHPYVR